MKHFFTISLCFLALSLSVYGQTDVPGCTISVACNYDPAATVNDGSCDFLTCLCLDGTVWSDELNGCVVENPTDTNLDGCTDLNDLMDILSAYGICLELEFAICGDLIEHEGYSYSTVQIGEQCWFSENLRADQYRNGDFIDGGLTNEEWGSTVEGAQAVYGETQQGCDNSFAVDFDACSNSFLSLLNYGRLYNWYAVNDSRGICPSGWHVPSDTEWTQLVDELGGGLVAGQAFRSQSGWACGQNGNNESGFAALPAGFRDSFFSYFSQVGNWTFFWSSTLDSEGDNAWTRFLVSDYLYFVNRDSTPLGRGNSVRCIKD